MLSFPTRRKFLEGFGSLGAGLLVAPFLADGITPAAALLKLGPSPLGRFLLESAEQGGRLGRWSFVGAGAAELVAFDGAEGRAFRAHPRDGVAYEADRWVSRDPLAELRERLSPWRIPEEAVRACLEGAACPEGELPPFPGGLVGFLGYDVVRTIEPLGPPRPDPVGTWQAAYLLADAAVAFDHLRRVGYVMALARWQRGREDPAQAYQRASERLEQVWESLHGPGAVDAAGILSAQATPGTAAAVSEEGQVQDGAFEEAVHRARGYIEAGDIFQVVLSRERVTPCPDPPLQVYRRLRAINPSPYMFYLELAEPRPRGRTLYLVGASPEVMVRLQGRRALLRPIAGTRARGRDRAEDLRREADLLADPKENAEHMMLVDLGRNDLGRVCDFGSVQMARLREVERYSHVMHLVSEVEGRLREGLDAFDLMRAAFPAGTVTGAPKVRAMQIIDELEAAGRGPYAGAVGYFSVTGFADSCITIRTLAIRAGMAHARAGAGIVADSQPRRELMETESKAQALLCALRPVES